MGNSASSQGSSTGTHDGDVGSSISAEQHDWPIEQAVDEPDVQSLQEMRKPYIPTNQHRELYFVIVILECYRRTAACQSYVQRNSH